MSSRTYSNRYEIKYLVEASQLPEIEASLREFLVPDKNGDASHGYFNYSIYFDSPDYHFYREKREGDQVRTKPRIRMYKTAPNGPPKAIFLELKNRYDRIVSKSRVAIDLDFAECLLSGSPGSRNGYDTASPTLGKFQYLDQRFRLAPCVTVLYHRTAYFGVFYPDLRVTFDRVIQCSRSVTLDNAPDSFVWAVPAHRSVIELKYNGRVPRLLLGRFHSLSLLQATISKFAISVERTHDQIFDR